MQLDCVGRLRQVRAVQERGSGWLPWVVACVFALTRIPGVLPSNFSAAYALMFCAGVFFPSTLRWKLPLGVMLVTDLLLNAWYQWGKGYEVFTLTGCLYLVGNYIGYGVLLGLGRCFKPGSNFLGLLGGGMLGAVLFYVITNTFSWLFNPFHNPEYTRDLAGWIRALTTGTSGWPQVWEFFRNTLLSGGLFTALFAGAWRVTAGAESPREKGEEVSEPAAAPEATPEPKEAGA